MTYIVIEGVIGVGKTALTRILGEQFSVPTLFEPFEENSFLNIYPLYQRGTRTALGVVVGCQPHR